MTSDEFRDYLDWLATPEARTSTLRWTPELANARRSTTYDELAADIDALCGRVENLRRRVVDDAHDGPRLTLIRGGRDA